MEPGHYFIEFHIKPFHGYDRRWGKKVPEAERYVWPKLFHTREEADAFLEMLNTGEPSPKRGLFANKDTCLPDGKRLASASVERRL